MRDIPGQRPSPELGGGRVPGGRVGPDYFARMYEDAPDPWGFATRWYERRKYDLTLAALPRRQYAAGLEPGCSIGVLSEGLAGRCARLVCLEQNEVAADQARRRLASWPGVEVRRARVPEDWPAGRYDLVVLSELGYYLGEPALVEMLDRAEESLLSGGSLVAVHWRPAVEGCSLTGEDVHRRIAGREALRVLGRHREDEFLLDVLERR